MSDFGDEEYHSMVCVEPGHVAGPPLRLSPGRSFTLSQEILIGAAAAASAASAEDQSAL